MNLLKGMPHGLQKIQTQWPCAWIRFAHIHYMIIIYVYNYMWPFESQSAVEGFGHARVTHQIPGDIQWCQLLPRPGTSDALPLHGKFQLRIGTRWTNKLVRASIAVLKAGFWTRTEGSPGLVSSHGLSHFTSKLYIYIYMIIIDHICYSHLKGCRI